MHQERENEQHQPTWDGRERRAVGLTDQKPDGRNAAIVAVSIFATLLILWAVVGMVRDLLR